ncbi:recombinase family protein [Microbacterium aurugineum]|uniref:recombinase family protein n=1 Tax=Microbacterium aurugineum TaxID=2851642 RepID=UPI0020BF9B93|nr:recombinase family protein [Microbacterium aurugineum]MCK8476922.1 recombinase family protein [Microbacterium aurugineum]
MVDSPVRAALYLRISTDREMDGLAIDRQRTDCLQIAATRGWQVTREYVDQSKSATDKTKRRPGYDALVHDFETGQFDAIVCWDLDRLTRQPRQLEDWIDAAEERGLRLVTANGEADLTTDGGRLFARVKAAVARSEVERKTARQSAAQAQRAAQGRAPKGMRPVGYTVAGDIVPSEAEAVRAIFAAFNSGSSLRAITAALSGETGERIPSKVPALPRHTRTVTLERNARREQENKSLPPQKKRKLRPVPEDAQWSPSTVLGMLRNPRYAGYSTYTPKNDQPDGGKRRAWRASILRDESGEPVRGQWKPIVDEGVWSAVQDRLDSPERVTNRIGTDRRHLGSGLYRCGVCGQRVRGHTGRYRCVGHVIRSRDQIDAYVTAAIRARLARSDLADLLPSRSDPRIQEIKAEIGAHRARIARAQRDYDAETIEGRDLKRVRDHEEAAIALLEAERVRLATSVSAGSVLAAQNPVAAFGAADLGAQRGVIEALCEVRLHGHPRGVKAFNPDTVAIDWRK